MAIVSVTGSVGRVGWVVSMRLETDVSVEDAVRKTRVRAQSEKAYDADQRKGNGAGQQQLTPPHGAHEMISVLQSEAGSLASLVR